MKTAAILLSLSLTFLFINGCTKKYNDALPQVQFVSVSPYGPDSVLLTGKVTKTGGDDVQYAGFSYSNQPVFDIIQNQVLLNGTNGSFSFPVLVSPDSTYYFKCFAANDFGYAVSNTVKYTAAPAQPDSAPCSLTNNSVIDNSQHWSMPFVYSGGAYATYGGAYAVDADDASGSGLEVLHVEFKQVPVNGIYTAICDESSFNDDNSKYAVYVTIGSSFNTYTACGGTLYIAQYKDGSTMLSFCSFTYSVNSNNYKLSAKITF